MRHELIQNNKKKRKESKRKQVNLCVKQTIT